MGHSDDFRLGSTRQPVDWHVDDEPDEPYELPEIVAATDDVPAPTGQPPVDVPVDPSAGEPGPADRWPAAPQPAGVHGPGEYVGPVPTEAASLALRRPGRRPRVRRVTRVLRHIDPWSAFKVGLLFSAVVYVVALTSGVLLWRVADSTGTLDNVERWFTQFGWETFEFDGDAIFRNARTIGLFGIVALTGGIVLLVTLFNLISDIVGGVRMTVLEEEVVERTASSTRRYVVRRTPAAAERATGAAEPAWDVDDGDDPYVLVAERPPIVETPDWSVPAAEVDDSDTGSSAADPVEEILAEPVDADWSVDGSDDDAVEEHDDEPDTDHEHAAAG